jgi:D-alanine-D-alanine ligase
LESSVFLFKLRKKRTGDGMGKKPALRVCVLFGGKSTEHEVSLTSAAGVMKQMDPKRYRILPVRIDKEGRWRLLSGEMAGEDAGTLGAAKGREVMAGDPGTQGLLCVDRDSGDTPRIVSRETVDVVLPLLHGTYGEDGTIQGLFTLLDLPCVGAGVAASALCMDKIAMKQMFFQNGLPGIDFLWFLRKDWEKSPKIIVQGVTKEVGYPCFIKPANAGSSVGVSKVKNVEELSEAVGLACQFDRKVLAEKAVDARELECAVLGNDKPEASVVGEIEPSGDFYDYDAKYISEDSRLIIPAELPPEVSEQVRKMAIAAYQAVDCAGMGRVDFLMDKQTGEVYVNEINTIPGFTPISMYPKLWEASGMSFPQLIDRLVELALERHRDQSRSLFRRQ